MITLDKERSIIQKCLLITGLSEIRGRYDIQNKKDEMDKVTLRIHNIIMELRTLFFDEKDVWAE